MKYAHNKAFPHPVLREDSLDYENCAFQAALVPEIFQGGGVAYKANFDLSDERLKALIRKQKAAYAIMVNCPRTHLRVFQQTHDQNMRVELPNGIVHDRTEACAYIVAEQRIRRFNSPNMNDEFMGARFDIEPGDVLAVCPPSIIVFDSPGIPIGAVIKVVSQDDRKTPDFAISLEGEIIHIQMRPEEKIRFDFAHKKGGTLLQHIFLGIHLHAIAEALRTIKEDEDAYENKKWFRVIKSACDNAEPPIEVENLDGPGFLREAQRLLCYPLAKLESPATGGTDD